jgi:hypothetical protein
METMGSMKSPFTMLTSLVGASLWERVCSQMRYLLRLLADLFPKEKLLCDHWEKESGNASRLSFPQDLYCEGSKWSPFTYLIVEVFCPSAAENEDDTEQPILSLTSLEETCKPGSTSILEL